jgi:hypothetical protein
MKKLTLVAALLLAVAQLQAQELSLFEPVETDAAQDQQQQPVPGFVAPGAGGQPAFTVRSTTHVGESYKVTLVNRQGQTSEVAWRPGERSPLPGMPGFIVEEIRQRSVVLSQPGNDPCVAAPQQGVSCLDSSRAVLTLALAAPLPPNSQGVQPQQIIGPNNGSTNGIVVDPALAAQNPFEAAIQAQQAQAAAQGLPVPVPGGQGFFVNPFSGQAELVDQQSPEQQATRDARQRARGERLNRLVEASRIPDDQIPPGMRRVTTPFGDRLVPERE